MNFIQHGKFIKESLLFITQNIKSKEDILKQFRRKYISPAENKLVIHKLALMELLDEFQGIINQSIQAIQTLQTEMLNLEELSLKNSSNSEKETLNENDKENQLLRGNTIYHRPKGIKPTITTNKTNILSFSKNNSLDIKNNCTQLNYSAEDNKKDSGSIKPRSSSLIESSSLYGELEPKPEQEKLQTPLIPLGISSKNILANGNLTAYSNEIITTETNYCSIPSRSEVLRSKIEKENKMKSFIIEISSIDTYKRYLSNKYGNGNYNLFIDKLYKNKISHEDLVKEVETISQEMKKDINKYKPNSLRQSCKPYPKNSISTTIISSNKIGKAKIVKNRERYLSKEITKIQVKQLNDQILQTFRQIDEL